MTKYILCGGLDRADTFDERLEKVRDFYGQIISSTPDTVKILLCTFAKEDKDVPGSVSRLKEIFSLISDKNIEFISSDKEIFEEQIGLVEVIFFLGGRTEKLLSSLMRYKNLETLFKDKIIVGESAGANILCTKSYSPAAKKFINCLALLPIKIIPHYKEEYKNIFLEKDKLERLILKEYEYKVYYK